MGNNCFKSATEVLEEVQLGDLIEFKRGVYQHWGVYVGSGYVVHVNLAAKLDTYAPVVKQQLSTVAGVNKCRVNNLQQEARKKNLKPRSPDETVQFAESRVGENIEYKLFSDNCEYFVTSCRYGKKDSFSTQVEGCQENVVNGLAATVGAAIFVFLGALLSESLQPKQEEQKKTKAKCEALKSESMCID